MEYPTRIFSWGYYEHITTEIISREVGKKFNPMVPLSSWFSNEVEQALKKKLLDMCRDFDSFFIEDFYPMEESEKILISRLEKVVEREI